MSNKHLRFAALIRVSTEKQEKQGESLRTQKTSNESAVSHAQGKIVKWYGGQEHATPGYEKVEVDKLLADAKLGKFDAVIVAYADRWSRDNAKSKEGLEILRKHNIRFFVGSTEYDLFDPQCCMMLGMSAEFGEFQAKMQKKKSLENRIHRARRGLPAVGKKPFGRTFNKQTGEWGVDQDKQKMILDIAKRYLKGEPLPMLSKEYGKNHSNIHKVLTQRCGDQWIQSFDMDDFNIHVKVPTTVPRLLDEKMIRAIKQKVESNKTFQRGEAKYRYLFSGVVICSHCGYTMSGQTNHNKKRYYRHSNRCTCKKTGIKAWVAADALEEIVMKRLFLCFGNPKAVQEAIEAATPNLKQANEARERLGRLNLEIEKISKGRDRLINFMTKGTITEAEAEKQLNELASRDSELKSEFDRLDEQISKLPSPAEIKQLSEQIGSRFKLKVRPKPKERVSARKWVAEEASYNSMTWDEKRALVQLVFSGKTIEGKRRGIFIEWIDGQQNHRKKKWRYVISGNLINEQGLVPLAADKLFDNFDQGMTSTRKKQQNSLVTTSVTHLPGITLLEFCFCERVR